MTDWLPLRFIFVHRCKCAVRYCIQCLHLKHAQHSFTRALLNRRKCRSLFRTRVFLSKIPGRINARGVHVPESVRKQNEKKNTHTHYEWRRLLANRRWKNVTIFSNYVMAFIFIFFVRKQYKFWTFRTSLCNGNRKKIITFNVWRRQRRWL